MGGLKPGVVCNPLYTEEIDSAVQRYPKRLWRISELSDFKDFDELKKALSGDKEKTSAKKDSASLLSR